MTEKYEYCSTVTRAFVQDCRFYCLVLKIDVMFVLTLVISLAVRSEGQRVPTAYNIRDCEEFDVHLTSFSSDTKTEVNIEKCRKFKVIDPTKFS